MTISASSRRQNREALESALACAPRLSAALAGVDPYDADFGSKFAAQLDKALDGYWPGVVAAAPEGNSPEAVLRNAWAVCRSPLEHAVLFRAARASAEAGLAVLAQSLWHGAARARVADPLAVAVAEGCQAPPDLAQDARFKAGLRVRYALASRLARQCRPSELIECALAVTKATAWTRKTELLRVAGQAQARSISSRLRPVEFLRLPDAAQDFVLSDEELAGALMPPSQRAKAGSRSWLLAGRRRRDMLQRAMSQLCDAMGSLNFKKADRLLTSLEVDALARDLFADASVARDRRARLSPQAKTWFALSAGACLNLSRLTSRGAPRHWSLSAAQIAEGLLDGSVDWQKIRKEERELIQKSWTKPVQLELARSGHEGIFDASATVWGHLPLSELMRLAGQREDFTGILAQHFKAAGADGAEILRALAGSEGPQWHAHLAEAMGGRGSRMTLGRALSPWIGSDAWRHAGGWQLHQDTLAGDLAWLARTRPEIVDPASFARVLALAACAPGPDAQTRLVLNVAWQGREGMPLKNLVNIADHCPQLADELAPRLAYAQLKKFTSLAKSNKGLLERLFKAAPAALQPMVYVPYVQCPHAPGELLQLLVWGVRNKVAPGWIPRWAELAKLENDETGDGLASLAIVLSRDLKRLRRLTRGVVPDERVERALTRAALAIQKAGGRPQPLLELAGLVGMPAIASLAAVMGQIRYETAPGHRLDAAYLTWQLPKKSGGNRTISAPGHALKRVQRAILERVLSRFEAHPAAFGFVKGRSIKQNAEPHVGSKIVANADIRDCFPSVKWPLVLGALRRDLGAQLSPAALQLMVDLCTANGGLPIGAPTSPALLNRVLVKTDEILSAAAQQRNCVYTRYADDLTFSGEHGAVEMLGVAKGVLSRIGLELDPRKTNIFRRGRRQVCTGLAVNERVSVPRRIRRRMRAAVQAVEHGKTPTWHGLPQSEASLRGRLAFLAMLHPQEAAQLKKRLDGAKD